MCLCAFVAEGLQIMKKKEKASPKKKKSSIPQTRKGLTIWICLTFFACAWMFVLGILVGRETVPVRFDIEKLQNELAALKEAVIKKELDQHKLDSDSADSKTKMGFYEALKNTGEEERLKADISETKRKKEGIYQKSLLFFINLLIMPVSCKNKVSTALY